MEKDARYWVDTLGLRPHPEGGHFRETYRAPGRIPGASDGEHPAGRCFCTAIYYLLAAGEVSRLHRLRSDETFHHYAGAPLRLHVLAAGEGYETVLLGPDPEAGQRPQATVRAGRWFGATVEGPAGFALVGCTVAPGFEFADFELADRKRLLARFPRQREVVERLT